MERASVQHLPDEDRAGKAGSVHGASCPVLSPVFLHRLGFSRLIQELRVLLLSPLGRLQLRQLLQLQTGGSSWSALASTGTQPGRPDCGARPPWSPLPGPAALPAGRAQPRGE